MCADNENTAKGRRFQQWVRDKLIEVLDIHPEDIESRSMGAGGEDLIMAENLHEKPFHIQSNVKIKRKLISGNHTKQATENSGKYEPVVFIKRNNHKPLVVVDADYFINLHKNT